MHYTSIVYVSRSGSGSEKPGEGARFSFFSFFFLPLRDVGSGGVAVWDWERRSGWGGTPLPPSPGPRLPPLSPCRFKDVWGFGDGRWEMGDGRWHIQMGDGKYEMSGERGCVVVQGAGECVSARSEGLIISTDFTANWRGDLG